VYDQIIARLKESGVPFTIHEHVPSQTVADALALLSFPTDRLLKTIAFRLKRGDLVLAALRGPDRVDYRKLAAALDTKRSEVMSLGPDEVLETFGVPAGTIGPIVFRSNLQIVFDQNVPREGPLYCGLGRADRTLGIGLSALLALTGGRVVPLAQGVS
jgi:Cys-tRNA(Pro)/Cys-tRNA(Cys) deacylase